MAKTQIKEAIVSRFTNNGMPDVYKVFLGAEIQKSFTGKTAEKRAKSYARKININTDVIEYMNKNASDMAESHLEAWKDRHNKQTKSELNTDLYINHDPSLQIEEVEENINRKLTSDEYDYVKEKFNKAVLSFR